MKKISIKEIKERLKGKEKEYFSFLRVIEYLGYIIETVDDENKFDIEWVEDIEDLKEEIEYFMNFNYRKIVNIYEIVK